MNESSPGGEQVFWINRRPQLTLRQRMLAKLGLRDSPSVPFTASMLISEIDSIQDEGLRNALAEQRSRRLDGASFTVVPVVDSDGTLHHAVELPRGRLIRSEE